MDVRHVCGGCANHPCPFRMPLSSGKLCLLTCPRSSSRISSAQATRCPFPASLGQALPHSRCCQTSRQAPFSRLPGRTGRPLGNGTRHLLAQAQTPKDRPHLGHAEADTHRLGQPTCGWANSGSSLHACLLADSFLLLRGKAYCPFTAWPAQAMAGHLSQTAAAIPANPLLHCAVMDAHQVGFLS